jgi:hypothetical protein
VPTRPKLDRWCCWHPRGTGGCFAPRGREARSFLLAPTRLKLDRCCSHPRGWIGQTDRLICFAKTSARATTRSAERSRVPTCVDASPKPEMKFLSVGERATTSGACGPVGGRTKHDAESLAARRSAVHKSTGDACDLQNDHASTLLASCAARIFAGSTALYRRITRGVDWSD